MITVTEPRVIGTREALVELLDEAGRSRVLLLACQNLKRINAVGQGLQGAIREFLGQLNAGRDSMAPPLLDLPTDEDLGHAPSWIAAGGVYEELLKLENEQPPEFIFCLDPWAAQLLSRTSPAATKSRWVLISDLKLRHRREHPDYWLSMEPWVLTLPFSMIVPRELWEEDVIQEAAANAGPTRPTGDRLHMQKAGAWQWRTISRQQSPPPSTAPVTFLVRYSGSILHLKAFLECLTMQSSSKDPLGCIVLANSTGGELEAYLRWHALAHPRVKVVQVHRVGDKDSGWGTRLDRFLEGKSGPIVLIEDHVLVPPTFVQSASKVETATTLSSALMSVDATAQVLTGNLDAVAHYEQLVEAFGRTGGAGRGESTRVYPVGVWSQEGVSPSARILELARQEDVRTSSEPFLLQLTDLP